ncbi:uncharacterized protein LOC130621227 [Hydractinia symbiolongicarpus]|uniref:uncharacterized protein LOC130621227 n=1 Tax=Hydractinia symbiolongicarpus TaxID=13093 RepID=UPI00254C2E62|nr:uncharacterized protein LOC130621227 [Hydractinia symbiolongicarpus]
MEFTILLLVLLYLPSGAGLTCYSCRSSNKMNCIAKQKEGQCRRRTDICVTMEFTQVVYLSAKTTKVISGYRKHCASRRFNCKSYCSRRLEMGYATCKVGSE